MRASGGSNLVAVLVTAFGLMAASQPSEAQETGEPGPVQLAEAAPIVESETLDANGSEAISLAPWAAEGDAETVELAKSQEALAPSRDQFQAIQPLAATNSASGGGSASAPGLGDSAPSDRVDPFVGSFSTAVPIQVPGFHGISPNLALTYNSSRGNGLAGVGWSLSGLSTIERASQGKGTPRLSSAVSTLNPAGLRGDYYRSTNFTDLTMSRVDSTVHFNWGRGGPITNPSRADSFSVRWTGAVRADYTETYTFYAFNDDTMRVWIDGDLLIDNPAVQVERSASVALEAGRWYSIKVELVEARGRAIAYLKWSSASTPKAPIPSANLYELDISSHGSPLADIVLLDGQELVPCTAETVSPSCATGGTHATKVESYARIRHDELANHWEVWGRDGTKRTYTPVMGDDTASSDATYRWVVSSVEDTRGNSVTYTWWCDGTPARQCYVETITYNGSTVEFHWEGRPDPISFAMGTATLGNTALRLKSVDVRTGVDRVRAYALNYAAESAATGRSLLGDVQMYGTDATLDPSGTVTGGTSLPKTVFDYASGTAGFDAGTVWSTDHTGTAYDGAQVTYADVTGDARADLIFHRSDNTVWVSVATTSGFSTRTQWAAPGGAHRPDQASFADVDGDGMTDLVFRKSTNEIGVFLSTGSGFTPPTTWLAMGGSYLPGQVLLGDLDGDGSAELVFRRVEALCNIITYSCGPWGNCNPSLCPAGYYQTRPIWCTSRTCGRDDTCTTCRRECRNCDERQDLRVSFWTGTGFTTPSAWINGLYGGNGDYHADQVKLGDLNGDGKADLVFRAGNNTLKVALSTGTSFGALEDWISFGGTYYAGQAQLADMNGDGKTDVVFRTVSTGCSSFTVRQNHCNSSPLCPAGTTMIADTGCLNHEHNNGDQSRSWTLTCQSCSSGSALEFKVALSSGNGFSAAESWHSDSTLYSSGQAKYADVNGDGRADLIFQTSANEMQVSLSTGNGFAAPATWAQPGGSYDDSQALYADVDGDGRTDLLFRHSNQTVTAYLGTGATEPTDALTSVTNPLGGTTTVDYTPSSEWTNQTLPMVLQTVSAITTDDGRGNTATTSYAYEGGLWDAEERRFLGFRKATTTLPCIAGEAACPYSETIFRQDRASAGRVEQADRFDGAGTLLTRALEEYVVNDTTAPYTALNTASESHIIVGAVTRRTRVTRDYDDYGNVVQETGHGDADVLGDEITAATDYNPNTGDYIVALPARIRSFDGDGTTGTLLTESRILYDDATDWTNPPVRGDPTETQDWLDTESRFISAHAEYDAHGNVTATVDPLGRRSEIDYDTTYNLYPIAARNPLYFPPSSDTRHQTSTLWDTVCGVPTVATDLNGNDTTTQYDALCRPIRTDLPDGGFTITSYNNLGDPGLQYVETQTPPADGSGNIWSRTYMDGFARPYRSTAKGPAAGQDITADIAFDDRGNVSSQTAPYYTGDPVYTTTFDYDALDRPVATNHPDGNWNETDYGVAGVFVSTTSHDELGHPVTIHLDAFGRAVRKEEPLATTNGTVTVVTAYTYDDLGRLTFITDDAGNAWGYTQDSLGRTLVVDDPDLGVWAKTYDDAGQLETQTDALAQVTRFTYDALGRVLTKTARDGTAQAELTTYVYDEAVAGFHNVGLLTRAENPSGILRYRYDQMGREVQRTYTVDGSDYTLASGFDIAGRLMWQDYPDGDSVGSALDPITYDSAGRLDAVPGLVTSATYDASGNADVFTRANGVVSTYGYSLTRGWLDSLTTTSGATSIQSMTYGRDPAGQITAVTSTFTDESWTYGYDALRRLLTATNTDNAAHDRSYTYDSIGNMLTNSGVTGTYSYPAGGSPRPHAVTSVGSWSYTYDANGNMQTGAGRTYTYNGDNRPTQIDTQAYTYGPDGERWKTVDSAPGGGTTLYLGGTIEIADGVMTKYLPGSAKRVGSPGDPLVETFWLHHDHQGSIQAITDAAGAQVQRFTYYPYGDRIATASAHEETKGWIGERQDSTGLFYLHARYYDPDIGRFNSADPSDPMAPGVGLNRYAYAFNNPVMRVDPWGLWADDDYTTNREFDAGADGRFGSSFGGGYDYSGNDREYSYFSDVFEDTLKGYVILNQFKVGFTNGFGNWFYDTFLYYEGPFGPSGPAALASSIWSGIGPGPVLESPDSTAGQVGEAGFAIGSVVAPGARTNGAKRVGGFLRDIIDRWFGGGRPTERYNRRTHYGGSQTDSPAARNIREAAEGQPCPTCGDPQVTGTPNAPSPQHDPSLVEHYYEHGGHAMTPEQRRAYARSVEAFNGSQCRTCQSREGATLSRYSREQAEAHGLLE